MTMVTVCLGRPTAAVAADITDATYGSITRLVVPDEVTQGEASSLTFDFEIASYGTPFALGDTYEFPTNLASSLRSRVRARSRCATPPASSLPWSTVLPTT